jgi:hypothetical protein
MIGRVLLGASPYLIAVSVVLLIFVENNVPLGLLWRPVVIVVAIAGLIHAPLSLVLGFRRGTFWACVVVAALAGFLVLAGALVLALTVLAVAGRGSGREYALAAVLCVVVGFLLSGVLVARGMTNGAFDWEPALQDPLELSGAVVGPNVHVLLLDGYPRDDVLASIGFDNGDFLGTMEALGFDHYAESRSNYDRTAFTVLSMLSMRHIEDIATLQGNVPADSVGQMRLASRSLAGLPIFPALEDVGYRTRVVQSQIAHVPIGTADEDDSVHTANNFELVVLQHSPLAGVLEAFGFAAGQHRSQIRGALDAFADPPDAPTFSFTHVIAPHPAYVFDADGGDVPAPPCYPQSCEFFDGDPIEVGWEPDEYRRRFLGNLEALNQLVSDAVQSVVTADPDAVIVVFSDHGIGWVEGGARMWDNLLLVRSPGHPELLGSDPTLINVLPTIFDAYLGTNLPRLANDRFRSGTSEWLDVEPVGQGESGVQPLVLATRVARHMGGRAAR